MVIDGIVKIYKDFIWKDMLKKIAILNKTLILKAKIAFRENIVIIIKSFI